MTRALVTGAASGIGAETARLLATRDVEVVGADVRPAPGMVALDVGDPVQWAAVIEAAGPFDSLVNCAGVRLRTALIDLSMTEWEAVLRINLTGTFLGIQAMARHWSSRGCGGSVVAIGSTTSFSAVAGQAHYVASKGGIVMLVKAAALELAELGIRVNAVAPGPIVTPMLGARLAEPGQEEWLRSQVPLGRLGQPLDVAEALAFLISDAASFITGVTLPVDGGWLTK